MWLVREDVNDEILFQRRWADDGQLPVEAGPGSTSGRQSNLEWFANQMNSYDEQKVETLYAVLGINADTPFAEVKRAFRFASHANHPDHNHDDPFAERRFKAIAEGWELIGTADRWTAYQARAHQEQSPPPSATSPEASSTRSGTPRAGAQRGDSRRTGVRELCVERANIAADGAVRWRVMLDGGEVGRLGRGQSLTVEVAPGHHQLQLFTALKARSPVQEVDLADGERAVYQCELLRPVPLKAFFKPSEVIRLLRTS